MIASDSRKSLFSPRMNHNHSTRLTLWIERLQNGDDSARDELIHVACERLRGLTADLLRNDRLHRWEETDDVLQDSLLSLHKSLKEVQPANGREFLRLAALHIRRTLIGYARRHFGPCGLGANYESPPGSGAAWRHPSDQGTSPSQAAARIERTLRLHEAVESLPDDLREVTELIWFHALPQKEVASLLAVDVRTVRRRWQRARLQLYNQLKEHDVSAVFPTLDNS